MARRKASDKKGIDKKSRSTKVQADNYSIAFEQLQVAGNIGGDIRIGHTIGYTAEQVSVLLKQITTTLQPKKFDGRCPYKGLEVFEEEDAELFFGRERLVNELVGRVKESRTVFITGPSGSGKSSLVRAGLIHALKQGAIKSSDRWLYETMKPGREPLKDLALAFSRLKSPELQDYFLAHVGETNILNKCAESVLSGRKDQRFLLFVDQFEEVFTQINNEEERIAFINMLAHAGTMENGRVIVLFAMRSDFVSNCATYPALNELLSQEFRQIGAMQPDELVSAIALPAMHVGLPVEHELIAQIINDMKGEPDALPLMQFALKDLFDAKQAEGGVIALTLKDYLGHGGIHKSLERHADATFAKLSEREQELTRSIFSGLIEIGRGTQDTKRTALFDELIPANTKAEEVGAIVQKLADARLIITDEQAGKDTVTISHEKLIGAWPWLKKLVNENRDVIAVQNEITGDAKEWEDHKRDISYLYSGVRLANVSEQLVAKKLVLSETSNEFVKAGQVQEHRNQRIRIIGIAVPIVLVVVGVIIFSYIFTTNSANIAKRNEDFAKTQVAAASTSQAIAVIAQANAEEAQQQTTVARAGELAAQSVALRDRNFAVSLLLGVEAFNTLDTVQTRSVLMNNRFAYPQLLAYLDEGTRDILGAAFSPDGKILASVVSGNLDYFATIILTDVQTGQPIGQPMGGITNSVNTIAFSPDGKMLASGSVDQTIILWDVNTGKPVGQPLIGHSRDVIYVTFSPDGKILASSGADNTIIFWNVESGHLIEQMALGQSCGPIPLTFSLDGKMLVSGCGSTITFWDTQTKKVFGQLEEGQSCYLTTFTFSPDGKTLAVGCADSSISLWDIKTLQRVGQPLTGDIGFITCIAFSSDGKKLAAGGGKIISVWDMGTRLLTGHFQHGDQISIIRVIFSLDGKTLASVSRDNTIVLWDLEATHPIVQPLRRDDAKSGSLTGWLGDGVLSSDGTTIAWAIDNTTIGLWDVESGRLIRQVVRKELSSNFAGLALSPNGKTLAEISSDGTIVLWNVETGQVIGQLQNGYENFASYATFSSDGNSLATIGDYDIIILWDVQTAKRIGQPLKLNTGYYTPGIALSADGQTLAVAGGDNSITLWNLKTGQAIGQPLPGKKNSVSFVSNVIFSPDGGMLAAVGADHTIILWDVKKGQLIGEPLTGNSSQIRSLAFSPDGNTLASGNLNSTITLWDVKTGQPLGHPFNANYPGPVSGLVFNSDGKTLISGGLGSITQWDMDTSSWIQNACERARRNLTRSEWAQYFSNEKYRKTCEQWTLEPEVTATPSPMP